MQRETTWQDGGSPISGSSKRLGMWLFIISDALTFATMLIVYAYCRLTNPQWPAPFERDSILQATAMTLLLLTSSVTMVFAVRAIRGGRPSASIRYLGATVFLGLCFIALHLREWMHLVRDQHVTLASNPWSVPLFGATFFGLTGLHLLHVAGGVIYVGIVAVFLASRRVGVEDVETSGLYWQFVDAVWLFIFPIVYLTSQAA